MPVFTPLAVVRQARCPGVVAGTSPTEFPGPGSGWSVRQQGQAKGGTVGWDGSDTQGNILKLREQQTWLGGRAPRPSAGSEGPTGLTEHGWSREVGPGSVSLF